MSQQIGISENMAKIIRNLKRYEAFESVEYLGFSEECPECEVISIKTKGAYRFPWKSRSKIESMINRYGYKVKYEYGCDCGSYDQRDYYLVKGR
ncbi:MAG: hypothetical protein JHC26_08985 [Thermofilum sp.]|jgi:hypothetical protein|uniref:hypothetical protein n=1 Tax=Thermofilum sp. TaxID=1961369 RepID=UPI00258D5CD8|nr:hypothetical protein [Thermofilum sp.]MCI4409213.1 hypothetical protein [Thermofilum sp.]